MLKAQEEHTGDHRSNTSAGSVNLLRLNAPSKWHRRGDKRFYSISPVMDDKFWRSRKLYLPEGERKREPALPGGRQRNSLPIILFPSQPSATACSYYRARRQVEIEGGRKGGQERPIYLWLKKRRKTSRFRVYRMSRNQEKWLRTFGSQSKTFSETDNFE